MLLLLLLLFLSTMETVLQPGLLARDSLGDNSSPNSGEQDDQNPGPNLEGGQEVRSWAWRATRKEASEEI